MRRLPKEHLLSLGGLMAMLAFAGCGSGMPPDVPANVAVSTGHGQVIVTWDAVAGATSYDVYSGSSPALTASSSKVTTTSATQTISGSNGSVVYVAVAARNDSGQSALSSVGCGVPSPGAAPGTAFTMYDALCGPTLDGALYSNALSRRRIQNGALELLVAGSKLESTAKRGVRPQSAVSVAGTGPTRVTAWRATINVPAAASAVRTGTASIQAALALVYQPLATRLAFPGSQGKLIIAQVGLQDTGTGLRFYRSVSSCMDSACASLDAVSNIAYSDGNLPVDQPADYGTPYAVALSLDESRQVFTFSVSGAGLAAPTTGTADASSLFTARGVNPANDFSLALLRARAFDPGASGGSSGAMLATFDDVFRGVAGAEPTLYDDFNASSIDPGRWSTGEGSLLMNNGALEAKSSITGTTTTGPFSGMNLMPTSLPAGTNQFRVDVTIAASNAAASPGSENSFVLTRALYNDGTAGTTPPNVNQGNSAVGDVQAQIVLAPASARFLLFRSNTAASPSGPVLTKSSSNPLPISATNPLGVGTTHTLGIGWNPSVHAVTFQLDDATPVTIGPTNAADPYVSTAAPVAEPRPHVESTTLIAVSRVGGTTGTSDGTTRINNILVAP